MRNRLGQGRLSEAAGSENPPYRFSDNGQALMYPREQPAASKKQGLVRTDKALFHSDGCGEQRYSAAFFASSIACWAAAGVV